MRTKTACVLSETDFTPLVDDGKSLRGKFMIDFCWYYGIPMIFSVLGGILVLGIALALMSDSIFD